MTAFELTIRARRTITPEGMGGGVIAVDRGRIVAVEPVDSPLWSRGAQRVDLDDDEVLLPGLVDSHVHVNDPGRTEWEGFATATMAAAAGGVTTIVDMPLNSIPPTVDVDALQVKRKTAELQSYVDVGFWGGAVPGNVADLRPLHEAGVYGFKCFLVHSGVDEFPPLDARQMLEAMREIASFDGLLLVHAEDHNAIRRAPEPRGVSYEAFLRSRPRRAENLAVAKVIELARRTKCRVHILHVSCSDVLPMIAFAARDGVAITAETCPHYLTFSAEEIPDGATQYKCCPPVREQRNRELLWEGLRDGVLGLVVSDHSPSTADLKCLSTGDFGAAWGGISSLQIGLPAVWTEAGARGFSLPEVVRWMCQAPAEQTGMRRKGRIAVGADADFCVFAPDQPYLVDPNRLLHRNPITPYTGRRLTGVVRETWLAGSRIDLSAKPRGRLLNRGDA
ncbi:allantoinase AllB [Pseudonocardiaceae bacterium YIM PH 21723]|nr:allantoinase AllB [Pseudonocardiaceae bacterium YIM PH 21723]